MYQLNDLLIHHYIMLKSKLCLAILFVLMSCMNTFSQVKSTFDYVHYKGNIWRIEVDTTRFVPEYKDDYVLELYSEKDSTLIILLELSNKAAEALSNIQKNGAVIELGNLHGERHLITKYNVSETEEKMLVHYICFKGDNAFVLAMMLPPNKWAEMEPILKAIGISAVRVTSE